MSAAPEGWGGQSVRQHVEAVSQVAGDALQAVTDLHELIATLETRIASLEGQRSDGDCPCSIGETPDD